MLVIFQCSFVRYIWIYLDLSGYYICGASAIVQASARGCHAERGWSKTDPWNTYGAFLKYGYPIKWMVIMDNPIKIFIIYRWFGGYPPFQKTSICNLGMSSMKLIYKLEKSPWLSLLQGFLTCPWYKITQMIPNGVTTNWWSTNTTSYDVPLKHPLRGCFTL